MGEEEEDRPKSSLSLSFFPRFELTIGDFSSEETFGCGLHPPFPVKENKLSWFLAHFNPIHRSLSSKYRRKPERASPVSHSRTGKV